MSPEKKDKQLGMWSSIGIKAGMLLATVGAVVWLGWSVPVMPQIDRGGVRTLKSIAPRAPRSEIPPTKDSLLRVNLNQATLEDLRTLPGIGPVLAQRILALRTKVGPFRSPEDLLMVKGVGAKRLARLRPLLHFDDSVTIKPKMSLFQPRKHRRIPSS